MVMPPCSASGASSPSSANDDAVAHMVCVPSRSATPRAAARNYGRPNLVQYHVLLACGPDSLALALHSDPYYIGLAILLALFSSASRASISVFTPSSSRR